jgi:hypothetical protein
MTRSTRLVWADRLAWGGAAATAIASLTGLVVSDLYRDSEALVRLTRADDAFRLLVLASILVVTLSMSARGSILARPISMAALASLVYLYGFVASAAAVNPMSLVQVAALGLAFWSLVLSWLGMDPVVVEGALGGRMLRRTSAVMLIAMAALSLINWGAILLSSAASGEPPADLARLGLTTNPLYAIELAFVVPILFVAGVWVMRRDPQGPPLAVAMLALLALLGVGLTWEAAGVAVAGGSFDGSQAVAGLVFALFPALLLLPIAVRHPATRADMGGAA